MRYTSDPVRDIDADNDERQRRSDAYQKELGTCIELVNSLIAFSDEKTITDIEEELMSHNEISACLYIREVEGRDAAWQALDDAIDRAIERIAARRVKE